ncbi:MAG: hypothetical protein IIC08_04220 [Proteobacteria bacterium]|nr:hypothetical protein [Pseudomonadota bacterium]
MTAGDTIRDVLGYVQFDADELTARLRASVQRATTAGRIDRRQADRQQVRGEKP